MSKTVLITGATSGIGKQLCKLYVKKGWEVWGLGRSQEKLDKLKKELNQIQLIKSDLKEFDIKSFKKQTKELKKLNLLINNAGYLKKQSLTELDINDFIDTYKVNVFSVHQIIQAVLTKLKKSKNASIINIGSAGGVTNTLKFQGMSAYSSSKGALSIYSECIATELRTEGINVNCLALGAVDTKMLNQAFPDTNYKVEAKKMASYVYSFSQESKIINGQTLIIANNNP